jgi:hypothetical protein
MIQPGDTFKLGKFPDVLLFSVGNPSFHGNTFLAGKYFPAGRCFPVGKIKHDPAYAHFREEFLPLRNTLLEQFMFFL